MVNTSLKIALAALMHDIGKFSQGGMSITKGYQEDNQQLYQPFYNGHFSHAHALYTAAFIEQYADILPGLCTESGGPSDESFINLAACHHKPDSEMQRCITQADRLSSGLDRAEFDKESDSIPFRQYRSTRLLSVLEALSTDQKRQEEFDSKNSYRSCYALEPLTAHSIFPVTAGDIPKEQAQTEYKKLFDEFMDELAELPHRENPELWAQHFDSLLAVYCSHIPAARAGKVVPDVSLYDHLRTTAALAVPLYLYHAEQGSLNQNAIQDGSAEKFLLVSGDFYGIQDFIFSAGGEKQRLRAKLLRGRSFAVSLFSELAAESICHALDLPFTAIFLNAAGKFHILAANSEETRKQIDKTTEELNKWLFDISFGQASIGITITPATPDDFKQGAFDTLWDRHLNNMDRKKYNRIQLDSYGVIDGFLNSFDSDLKPPLCPFCGKRPSTNKTKKDSLIDNSGVACAICRDHIMLGANLVRGRNIAVFRGEINADKKKRLLEPVYGSYQVSFHDDNPDSWQGNVIKFWKTGINEDGSLPAQGTLRLLNGYVPLFTELDKADEYVCEMVAADQEADIDTLVREGVPKTFNLLAAMARHGGKGTEALGVLKADVDNLGLLLSCGLPSHRFTISRMATLSRRLDQFFSLYLPYLLKSVPEFQNIYTVFAGGDDLFLIGPWNCMAGLAERLRQDWGRYVSGNDSDGALTFSAGITLHKPHSPVDKFAATTEEALEQAKDAGRNRVVMFGECITWNEFSELLDKSGEINQWVSDEYISNVMLYRFNTFIDMAGRAKKITDGGQPVHIEDMECFKWRPLFKYSLERNIKKKGEEKKAAMLEVSIMAEWLENYGSALKVALWSLLYNQR